MASYSTTELNSQAYTLVNTVLAQLKAAGIPATLSEGDIDGIEFGDTRVLVVREVCKTYGFKSHPQGKFQVKLPTVHFGLRDSMKAKAYQENSKDLITKLVKDLLARHVAIVAYNTRTAEHDAEVKKARARVTSLQKAFPEYADHIYPRGGTSLAIEFGNLDMDQAKKILQALETCGVKLKTLA